MQFKLTNQCYDCCYMSRIVASLQGELKRYCNESQNLEPTCFTYSLFKNNVLSVAYIHFDVISDKCCRSSLVVFVSFTVSESRHFSSSVVVVHSPPTSAATVCLSSLLSLPVPIPSQCLVTNCQNEMVDNELAQLLSTKTKKRFGIWGRWWVKKKKKKSTNSCISTVLAKNK